MAKKGYLKLIGADKKYTKADLHRDQKAGSSPQKGEVAKHIIKPPKKGKG